MQAKGYFKGHIRVLDLTEDEFRRLSSRTTRTAQWTNTECPLKLFNRTPRIPFFPALLVTRETTVPLVCCVF